MRTFLFIIGLLIASPVILEAKAITVQVNGMVCGFCAQGIEKKFKSYPEISKIEVSLESKKVVLDTAEGKDLDDEKIKQAITEAGYEVVKIERAP